MNSPTSGENRACGNMMSEPRASARAVQRLQGTRDCPMQRVPCPRLRGHVFVSITRAVSTLQSLRTTDPVLQHPRGALIGCLLAVVTLGGCSAAGPSSSPEVARAAKTQAVDRDSKTQAVSRGLVNPIRRVFCLFDQKRWMNLDATGDRDPEGVHYRVYLVAKEGKGVWRDGQFHIEMYRIDHEGGEEIERTLISDWDYPISAFQRVDSPILGRGYHIRLRWARKDTAGSEIELITHYRTPDGHIVRSGTQRLRVPKYTS